MSSRHVTSKQRRINVDATSWCHIDDVSTSCACLVVIKKALLQTAKTQVKGSALFAKIKIKFSGKS